ncbi:MAG TPA: sulfocyanin-like copper-binding protein [Terriglobales bacterium]|nr:sulfocyanin-like copper-binding protein [Terriglobales bacterium]
MLLVATAAWAAAGPLPFRLISKQSKQYASQANFPMSSPELRPDRQGNRLSTQAKGKYEVLALAGPKGKMMSFQIETLSNPEIRLPAGSELTLDVVNVDDDMVHDLYLTAQAPPYPLSVPATAIGTAVLKPYKGQGYSGSRLVVEATHAGTVYYVCTVPGHAKKGMYGKIVITP